MKNPFKELESQEKAPEELKKKVMASINLSQLMVNLTDLFVGKAGSTVGELLKSNKKNKKK